MKYGIATLVGHGQPLGAFCRRAAELGYDYMELNCVLDYYAHCNARELAASPEFGEMLAEMLEELELGCSAVDCHGVFGRRPEEVEPSCDYLRAGFQVARWLDAPVVATSIPGGGAPWEAMVARMRELCAEAAEMGLVVALEAEANFGIGTPDELEHFLADVAAPNLKVNFDPSHFAQKGFDVAATVRRFFSEIAHVHLKEYLATERHPTWYAGALDSPCAQMLDELARLGYGGVASAETLANVDLAPGEEPAAVIMNGIRNWERHHRNQSR